MSHGSFTVTELPPADSPPAMLIPMFPFEWIEGHRWSVLRVFEKGLTRWYRVRMELEALPGGGTRLHYSMEFEPVFAFLAFLVKLEVGATWYTRSYIWRFEYRYRNATGQTTHGGSLHVSF